MSILNVYHHECCVLTVSHESWLLSIWLIDLSINESGMVERGELQAACQKVLMELLAGLPPLPAAPVPKTPLSASVGATSVISSIPISAPYPQQTSTADHHIINPSTSAAECHASSSTYMPTNDTDRKGNGQHLETNVAVEAAKIRGNTAFSSGDFKKAISHYTMAIRISIDGEGQPAAQSSALAVLYSNRSAAHSGLKYYGKALEDAEEAIRLDPG